MRGRYQSGLCSVFNLVTLATGLALFHIAGSGEAATFTVNSTADEVDCNAGDGVAETGAGNGVCTLRAAIMEANALPGADEISVPAGEYKLTIAGIGEGGCRTGDLDVTSALTISGADQASTVVDINGVDRGFDIRAEAAFSNMTIKNANTSDEGGGILSEVSLMLTKCTFSANTALCGGGVYNSGPTTMSGCTFSGNTANGGGGFGGTGTADLSACVFSGNESTDWAGGMTFSYGDVTLTQCVFDSNQAGNEGGGLDVRWSNADVSSCTFTNNGCGHAGGGFSAFQSGEINILDSIFSGNSATFGGAFCSQGIATVEDCLLSGNYAHIGGGAYLWSGSARIRHCSFSENTADSDGGGIRNYAQECALEYCVFRGNQVVRGYGGGVTHGYEDERMVLNGCTFEANSATSGGGMITFSQVMLTNCTLHGNTAYLEGGGLTDLGETTLLNCTVTANVVLQRMYELGEGGGLWSANQGGLRLGNTIVAGNSDAITSDGTKYVDVCGRFLSLGHNLIGDITGGSGLVNGVLGDRVGTAIAPIKPLLSPLADNGGPTRTCGLLAGSPAIDGGDNNLVASPAFDGPPFFDQRGVGHARIGDGDGNGTAIVDIGAFELKRLIAPIARTDQYTVEEGGCLDVSAPGVLANDTDEDGDSLTTVLVLAPSHGVLVLDPDGSFVYTHDGTQTSEDLFFYRVSDGTLVSYAAPVRITITAGNHSDVNQDDQVDSVDVQMVINAALGVLALQSCDVNRDGAANALDVQLVINAALGL